MTAITAAWPLRWPLRRRRPRHCAPRRRRTPLTRPRHAVAPSPATRSGPAPAAPEALLMAAPVCPSPDVEASWADVTSVDLLAYQPPRYVRDPAVVESCETLLAVRQMAGMFPC